jgi:hypothetical protein
MRKLILITALALGPYSINVDHRGAEFAYGTEAAATPRSGPLVSPGRSEVSESVSRATVGAARLIAFWSVPAAWHGPKITTS